MGRSAGWLAADQACAIISVTINSTGLCCSWLAACKAATVTCQACHYLIDLSGKRLVMYKLKNLNFVITTNAVLGPCTTDSCGGETENLQEAARTRIK